MILVRHGQTPFNLHFGATRIDPGIEDPGLTDLGRAQAAEAGARLAAMGLRRMIASPYLRTLETAEIVNAALRLPIGIDTRVRERAGFACDVGTPPHRLAARWPHLDFGALDDGWWRHGHGDGDEPEESLLERVGLFRRAMATAPDSDAAVVITHWGVIRALTGRRVENGAIVRWDPRSGAFEQLYPSTADQPVGLPAGRPST